MIGAVRWEKVAKFRWQFGLRASGGAPDLRAAAAGAAGAAGAEDALRREVGGASLQMRRCWLGELLTHVTQVLLLPSPN